MRNFNSFCPPVLEIEFFSFLTISGHWIFTSCDPLLCNGGPIATGLRHMVGSHGPYLQPEFYRNRFIIAVTGAKCHLLPGWDTATLKMLRLWGFLPDPAEIFCQYSWIYCRGSYTPFFWFSKNKFFENFSKFSNWHPLATVVAMATKKISTPRTGGPIIPPKFHWNWITATTRTETDGITHRHTDTQTHRQTRRLRIRVT